MEETMELSPVLLHQFHNQVERVLHVKGNFTGPVLEMTVVLDHSLQRERMQECVSVFLRSLKQKSEVFRNVRLNITDWTSDDGLTNLVKPMFSAMSDSFYESYQEIKTEKRIEVLYQYLKFYHARSKLILIFTDGQYRIGDKELCCEALKPFLSRKLIRITVTENGIELG